MYILQDADIPPYARVVFQYCQLDTQSGGYKGQYKYMSNPPPRAVQPADLHQLLHALHGQEAAGLS